MLKVHIQHYKTIQLLHVNILNFEKAMNPMAREKN